MYEYTRALKLYTTELESQVSAQENFNVQWRAQVFRRRGEEDVEEVRRGEAHPQRVALAGREHEHLLEQRLAVGRHVERNAVLAAQHALAQLLHTYTIDTSPSPASSRTRRCCSNCSQSSLLRSDLQLAEQSRAEPKTPRSFIRRQRQRQMAR